VVLTLGFVLYAVASTSTVELGTYSQYQLIPVANDLMQNFVQEGGIPANWGTNASLTSGSLINFGLAQTSPLGPAYSLDPFKLNRIINNSFVNNTLYIPPTAAGKLLGIYQNNHFSYGFNFRMVPALNITICAQGGGGCNQNVDLTQQNNFTITVTDFNGQPAVNAIIKATEFTFCESPGSGKSPSTFGASSNVTYGETNLTGQTFGVIKAPSPNCGSITQNTCSGNNQCAYLLTVSANYYGLQFQNYLGQGVCKAQMIIEGQYLVANFTGKSNPLCNIGSNNGVVFTQTTVFEVTSSLNVILNPATYCGSKPPCNILNNGAKNYSVFQLDNPMSSSVVFAGLIINTNGKNFFVITSNPITYTGIIEYASDSLTTVGANAGQQGLQLAQVNGAVTVTRYVTVGTNTWFASLTVWRMGSP